MLRAFVAIFRCAIDTDEIDSDEPVTVEHVKAYLNDALQLGFDTEEHGNPVGLESVEVNVETLVELLPDEVAKLYI